MITVCRALPYIWIRISAIWMFRHLPITPDGTTQVYVSFQYQEGLQSLEGNHRDNDWDREVCTYVFTANAHINAKVAAVLVITGLAAACSSAAATRPYHENAKPAICHKSFDPLQG